jgi:hypothetical protein
MHQIILKVKTERALRAILDSLPLDGGGIIGWEVCLDQSRSRESASAAACADDRALKDKVARGPRLLGGKCH